MCILFIVCDMIMWRNMAGFACSFSIFKKKLCIEFFIAGKPFIEMYVYSTVGWLLCVCVCVFFPEVQRLLWVFPFLHVYRWRLINIYIFYLLFIIYCFWKWLSVGKPFFFWRAGMTNLQLCVHACLCACMSITVHWFLFWCFGTRIQFWVWNACTVLVCDLLILKYL